MSVQGPVPPAPDPYGGFVSTVTPPPPPPGPGVVPPFVSPPTDGTRQRRWWAVGIGGGAALLLCVGGLFGIGALLVFGSQMRVQESQAAVTNYLTAIKNQQYGQAYDELCSAERSKISKRGFQASFEGVPPIDSFRVAQPVIAGNTISVPATIVYADGATQNVEYRIVQDGNNFEVCGEVG